MTAKDIKLIEKAKNDFWENIKPEEADTEEAREILDEIRADGQYAGETFHEAVRRPDAPAGNQTLYRQLWCCGDGPFTRGQRRGMHSVSGRIYKRTGGIR